MKFWKSASYFGNHPDSRNLWKAKPCAINEQSEGLSTSQCLLMANCHFKFNLQYYPNLYYQKYFPEPHETEKK